MSAAQTTETADARAGSAGGASGRVAGPLAALAARGLGRRRLVAIALLLIVCLGGGLRAARAADPGTANQSTDETAYGRLALSLAATGSYGSGGMAQPLHWSPGAPVAFAVAHKLAPAAPEAAFDVPAAYWINALAGVVTVLAAFALAALVAGAVPGLIAAAVVATYPPLVRATGELLSEPLGACLLTLALAAMAWVWPKAPWWRFALPGALLGAAVLVRADFLLAPAGLAVFAAAAELHRARPWRALGRGDVLRGLGAGAALAVAFAVVLLPWSAYASERAGRFVAVTEGAGPALFVGTYLPGNGQTGGVKREFGDETRRRVPALRGVPDGDLEAGAVLTTVARRYPGLDRDAALQAAARENLRRYPLSEPVAWTGMVLEKWRRMWLLSSRAGSPERSLATRGYHLVLVPLAFLALIAGLVRVRGPRRGVLAVVLLVLLYSTALHALVVAKPRYNLPLMPALVAAGVAGAAVARRPESRGPGVRATSTG